jgi:GLPGLI family protein
MKYTLLLLLSFSQLPINSHAQTSSNKSLNDAKLVCKYSLVYRPDSTSTKNKQSVFTLITDKAGSVFKDDLAIKRDSLLKSYENVKMSQQSLGVFTAQLQQMSTPDFAFSVYKEYSSKQVIYLEKLNKVDYFYAEPDKSLNWTIVPEDKNISGYSCRKATVSFGGRSWEAWFTKEVPVADGPYKFWGLPGLIIQINDSRNEYNFSLLKLSQAPSSISTIPSLTKATKTTKLSLVKAKKDYQLAAPDRMAARGSAVSESLIQSYREKIKRQNNPLELN